MISLSIGAKMMQYCPQCQSEIAGLDVCPTCSLVVNGELRLSPITCGHYRERLEAILPDICTSVTRAWNIVTEFDADTFDVETDNGIIISVRRMSRE